MSGMPLDHKSFFISLWLETLLYGFHVVLFCFCLYILLRHKRPGYAVFLVTAVFIFAFSTTHIFIAFVGFMRCFHPHKTCTHEVNELRWPNVVSPKTFAYVMNAFFADALVVYRCYAIWNFDTYYILPAVVLVLVTAMVGVSVFEDSPKAIQPSPPFFVLSLITNLYTTAMAAGRLYYFLPAVRKYWGNTPDLQRRYSRAFIIILETGAFNSACFVIFLVVCQNKATEGAALLVLQCVAQIFGIIPTFIIVIVGLGFESEFKCRSDPNQRVSSDPRRRRRYVESMSLFYQVHHTETPSPTRRSM